MVLQYVSVKKILQILALFIVFFSFAFAIPAHAQETQKKAPPTFEDLLREGILRAGSSDACKNYGNCSISDILQLVTNVMVFLLGISGSIFLLMFVYGGFTWMLSQGEVSKYQKGLDTMRDAIIGLIIMFSAYIIVNSVLSLIRSGTLPESDQDLQKTIESITETPTIQIN